MEMLDDGPRNVTRLDFVNFVRTKYSDSYSNIVLETFYPKGIKCKVYGLIKKIELNEKIGICTGMY